MSNIDNYNSIKGGSTNQTNPTNIGGNPADAQLFHSLVTGQPGGNIQQTSGHQAENTTTTTAAQQNPNGFYPPSKTVSSTSVTAYQNAMYPPSETTPSNLLSPSVIAMAQKNHGTGYNYGHLDTNGKISIDAKANGLASGLYIIEIGASATTQSSSPPPSPSPSQSSSPLPPVGKPGTGSPSRSYGKQVSFGEKIVNGIKAVGNGVVNLIAAPFRAVGSMIKGTAEGIYNGFIKPFVPQPVSGSKQLSFGENVVNGIKAVGNGVVNLIAAPFRAVGSMIKGTAEGIYNGFIKPFVPKPVMTFVQHVAAPVVKFIKHAAQQVKSFFSRIFKW